MSEKFDFGGEIVWQPTPEYVEHSNLKRFMDQHGIGSFDELMDRSTADVAWFTDAVFKFLDIQFQKPYSQVVDLSHGIQWPEWCVGGQLNIVTNCVDKWAENEATAGETAVLYESEEGDTRSLTYAELHRQVNQCANALRSLGLAKTLTSAFTAATPEIVIYFCFIGQNRWRDFAAVFPAIAQFLIQSIGRCRGQGIFTADSFSVAANRALNRQPMMRWGVLRWSV
ncbi:MAG: hypothetical protein H6667_22135 [Ardenticatenaceae bacterium]|nr:hypothetical protein [Ardenticatenaceae bacterium]